MERPGWSLSSRSWGERHPLFPPGCWLVLSRSPSLEPQSAELLGSVGAKADEHGVKVAAVLLSRQPHRCIKGRGWIELVGVDQAAQLLPPAAAELGGLARVGQRSWEFGEGLRTGCWLDPGPDQPSNSTNGLQEALLDQAIEVIPDVIGMGGAAEMEAQLKVEELGGIGKVRAGNE